MLDRVNTANKKSIAPFVAVMILSMLSACGGKGAEETNKESTQAATPQISENKISSSSDNTLSEQARVTNAIIKSNTLDMGKINAQVEDFRQKLVVSQYFQTFADKAISNEVLQDFYQQQQEQYSAPSVHVSHILYRVSPTMNTSQQEAILLKAKNAFEEIQKQGNFDEVAKRDSSDKVSARKAGDLGWIKAGDIAPEFSKVAFALGVDQVSEPVRTSFGFHLIKLLEAEKNIAAPFEKIIDQVRVDYRKAHKETEIKRLLELQ